MAESQHLHLELVTPEKLTLSGEVEMAVVPGEEGDMGIMAWHAPIISQLRPGLIEIYRNGQVSNRYFVSGGYVEVHENRCTVLAEELVDAAGLSKTAIEADIEQMQRQADLEQDPQARERLLRRLALAEAQKLVAA